MEYKFRYESFVFNVVHISIISTEENLGKVLANLKSALTNHII